MSLSHTPRFIHIGTGGFGGYWCHDVMQRLVQQGKAVPAAVVDVNPDNLRNAVEAYGISEERCFTSAPEAFAKAQADFAIIVVPPAYHEQMVDLALAHDMHILSEKPLADSMAASARIYQKVTASGKKMAVTMSHRFDQDKQSLERLIKSGAYGKLDYLVGRNTWMCRKFPAWGAFRYSIPDPLLIEGTVHHFDIMRSLAGANAKTVYASTWNPEWSEFAGDAQGLINVQMENGVRVFYEGAKANASQLNGWCQDYWRAECEQATLVLDNRKLSVVTGAVQFESVTEEKLLAKQPAWMNPWLAELFIDWLTGGEAPPNTLEDNIQCAALLFAAIESAHSGQVVDVQEYLHRHLASIPA